MNGLNGSYNTYRLVNDEIRPGSSPQDIVMVVREATGATGTVNVPIKPGTEVEYYLTRTATVVDNGGVYELAFNNGTDAIDRIVILAKAQSLQIGGIPI